MAIQLYHHPFTRAASVVWMLEEIGHDYELRFVDVHAGEQKRPELLALNRMGKVPVLVDGDAVVSETAAIGLYLADRYAPGRLAPALDDPARAFYLRWALFAPSVLEPVCTARASGWTWSEGTAGWGAFETVLETIDEGLAEGPWLLGERFTMADVVFGSTLRFMLRFRMIEPKPRFADYVARLSERPAALRADARNAAVAKERGLSRA